MSSTISHKKTLFDLKKGETGKIVTIVSEDANVTERLLEMGFTPGERVTVMSASPFGEPICVNLRGIKFALRKKEAECIEIE